MSSGVCRVVFVEWCVVTLGYTWCAYRHDVYSGRVYASCGVCVCVCVCMRACMYVFISLCRPEFLKLPFQAILCSLEDVAPCDGTLDWPAATCEELQRLTSAGEWKPLVLQVKWKPRSSQPVDSLYPEPTRVELVDTSSVSCIKRVMLYVTILYTL